MRRCCAFSTSSSAWELPTNGTAIAVAADDRPDRRVDPDLQTAINNAIAKGVKHLKKAQAADGSWSGKMDESAGGLKKPPYGGLTALALYALGASGVGSDDLAIQRGLEWVKANPEHRSVAVDIDQRVLDWGHQRHIAPLSAEQQSRIALVADDVREVDAQADVLMAMNFTGHPGLSFRSGLDKSPTRTISFVPANPEGPAYTITQNVSLHGRLFEEGRMLAVARALEERLDVWHHRPPVD